MYSQSRKPFGLRFHPAPDARVATTAGVLLCLLAIGGTALPAQDLDVTPDGGNATATANTTGNTVTFTITNNTSSDISVSLSCGYTGAVTSCSVDQSLVPVAAFDSWFSDVTYSAGAVGSGTVTLTGTTMGGSRTSQDKGWYDITVETSRIPPSLDLAPHNGDYLDRGRCAASCFDSELSYSTPAYVSLDAPRSATLIYTSAQAWPRATVQVDATDSSADGAPTRMSIRLKRSNGTWVTFVNGSQEIFFTSGSGTTRLAAQFDASALATGAYAHTLVVRSWWSDGTMKEATAPIRVLVNNQKASAFGAGWSVAGLQRLVFVGDSVLVTEGDGSAAFFRGPCGSSGCTYRRPDGDFTDLSYWLRRDGVVEYRRRYPDGTTLLFDATGLLASATDRFGNKTSYAYSSGRVSSITDPIGKTLTFAYNSSGKLSSIKDPGNRYSYFTINSAGDLTTIRDPAGGYPLQQATYDAQHRLKRRTDRGGATWASAYSYANRLSADTMPSIPVYGSSSMSRPVVRYRSVEDTLLASVAAGKGSSSNPADRFTPSTAKGRITNARGFSTFLLLDRFGAPTRVEEPLGRITQIARNQHSQDTTTTAPSGHRISKVWSGANVTKVVDRTTLRTINIVYESTYNEVQRVYGDTDSLWHYWSSGKLDSVRVGRSTQKPTKLTYDTRGRVSQATDPAGHITSYFYGGSFLNTDSIKAGLQKTIFLYDGFGRESQVKDGSGYATAVQYDAVNRVTRTIGPVNDTTRIFHGPVFVDSLEEALHQRYRFAYNALGWTTRRTDPIGKAESYEYDVNGNVRKWVNRRGGAATATYDALDRLLSRTADGRTTSVSADPADRYLAVTVPGESTDTLKFDVAGRPQYQIAIRGTTKYLLRSTYDRRDVRTALNMTTPFSRAIGYRYNAYMQLDTLIDVAGGKTVASYNVDRQPIGLKVPGGVTVSRSYPSTHRPGGVTYSNSSLNSAVGLFLAQDKRSLIHERANTFGDSIHAFSYDGLRRLVRDTLYWVDNSSCVSDGNRGTVCDGDRSAAGLSTYSYDKVGNPTDRGASPAGTNRLTTFAGYNLVYDADGNVVRKYTSNGSLDQHLYWSTVGQLDSVRTNGATVRFGYDGFGRRVRKSTNTSTVRYIHDGANLFMELDGSGNIRAEYTYYPGVDQPHSVRRGGGMYYFAVDYPGNVLGLFTGSGALANEYRYSLFGQTVAANETIENPLRYAAREFDVETGLYYFRARYYDPAISRFVSEDPIGLAGGINPYSYANNSPHNFSDPFGLSAQDCPSGMSRAPDGTCGYNLPGIVATVAGGGPGWMPIFGPRDPSMGMRLGSVPGSAKLAGGGGSFGSKAAAGAKSVVPATPTCGQAWAVLGATAVLDGIYSLSFFAGVGLLGRAAYVGGMSVRAMWAGDVVGTFAYASLARSSAAAGGSVLATGTGKRVPMFAGLGVAKREAGFGSDFSWMAALVPGVATFNGIRDVKAACP